MFEFDFPWFYNKFSKYCLEWKTYALKSTFSFLSKSICLFTNDYLILPIPIRHHVRHRIHHDAEVRPCMGNLYFYLINLFLLFYSVVKLGVHQIIIAYNKPPKGYMYVIIIRPYKEIKSNIIEIINETYFLIFLSSLFFLNKEKDWNSTKSSVYND